MSFRRESTVPVDPNSNCVATIDGGHAEIHRGSAWRASHRATVNDTQTVSLLLTTATGANELHAVFNCVTSAGATFQIYEGTTATGGTAVTAINRNRNSAKTTSTVCVHSPTISATGTRLFDIGLGAGNKTGGESREQSEYLLANGQTYLVKATATANANIITVVADWYEHPNYY